MKIILNKDYGGFSVSLMAYKLYAEKKGIELYAYYRDYSNYLSQGVIVYRKIDWTVPSLLEYYNNGLSSVYCFTKNLGESIIESKENKEEVNEIFVKYSFYLGKQNREDPILIEVVEELGNKANGSFSDLKVVEIPDELDYVIDNYDGYETLHQRVKIW